jgi:signal transduction histidine kinase
MKSKRPWGLVIVAFLLVAVFLVLGNQSFRATEKAAFDEFNQRQLVLAKEAVSGVELYFETLAGDMRALGRIPGVQHLDEASTRQEIEHTFNELEPLGVNDVWVLDANGVLRYSVTDRQVEGLDFSWQRYYQETKGMAFSDTYVVELIALGGVDAGQEDIVVAVPVFETATDENTPASPSDGFSGVVLCTLGLGTVTQTFVAPVKSSERGHALLIDDEYNVLWSPDRSLLGKNLLEETEGFPAFQQVVEKMNTGDSGTAEYTYYKFEEDSTDGYAEGKYTRAEREEKLIAYAPIHLGKKLWVIGAWAPREDARQLIRAVYRSQLLVVGLSILTTLLGSSYTLALSLRTTKLLKKEVETKTKELEKSYERLLAIFNDLEAAHAFQQSVIDGVAEPIMVIDRDYRVKLMNRAARDFSSGDADISGPVLCYQVSHHREVPCDGAEHPCPLEQVRESGQPVTVVHEHYQADGEWRVVELLASPLWGEDGGFQGIIESLRDVTERKRTEEALEAAYAFQQSLVEEERQRIARELHDGLAQLLGYVNTKAMAVRLMLKNRQMEAADQHLLQLEEAARELFVDVREAILDLKMSGQGGAGLIPTLQDFTAQFSRLSGLPVELTWDSAVEDLSLTAEIELQLLRIAQEALANVRKHASATKARVNLLVDSEVLELGVSDDGKGFDPARVGSAHWPHIGLSTMRERAETIDADFELNSRPGVGTRITVRLMVKDIASSRPGPREC